MRGLVHMTDEEYFKHPAISQSGLKIILNKTPYHFKYGKGINTKSTEVGSAIHCAILEPKRFADQYCCMPDGKSRKGKDYDALIADGKIVLTQNDYEEVQEIRHAILNQPQVMKLLSNGIAEQACFGDIEGTEAKCKIDYLRHGLVAIDLKSTKDASPKGFTSSVTEFGYHQQAAFYLDLLKDTGNEVEAFIFVAIEKEPPYAVGIYELDDESIQIGRELNQKALRIYEVAMRTGVWRGYSEDIETLALPDWYVRKVA